MSETLRIAYAGTPGFAVPALEMLIDSEHEVAAVFTQPDRPAGRGRRLQVPPVKQVAEAAGLPVWQPQRLSADELSRATHGADLDVLVVVAFGQLLPAAVLDLPRHGSLNVHASLLPRWRGAAPIARALLAGDERTGVTVMRMTPSLDAGPILLQRACPIGARDTAGSLHDQLARMGATALAEVLADLSGHLAAAVPQVESEATLAPKLSRAEGALDWSQPVTELERRVRALQPWPGAWTCAQGDTLRVWSAEAYPGAPPVSAAPGTVIACNRDGIDVVGGDGVLRILRLQAAGHRAMRAHEFANARDLSGCRLGS